MGLSKSADAYQRCLMGLLCYSPSWELKRPVRNGVYYGKESD
nr:MAG TPA: hypothetical protein [Caudoviricetes sp.]